VERRLTLVSGSSSSTQKHADDENVPLARKGKSKNGSSKGHKSNEEKKKKLLSNIKCFGCSHYGHYVNQCPNKKKGDTKKKQHTTTSVDIHELSSRLEDEFTLVAYLSSYLHKGLV